MIKRYLVAATLAVSVGFGASQAFSATILPDPLSTYDGIPVAIQFDDFYSYSAALMTEFGFSGFNYSTGTGTLDLILMTGAGGANNLNTGAGGSFSFEDPMPSSGGGTESFAGTWGAGVQDNGPVTVDNLYNYLIATYGPTASVPVFTFDMNQTGSNQDLLVMGRVSIVDPLDSSVVAAWYFDSINNSAYDANAYVLAPGNTVVTGLSGTTYDVDNNLGSGSTSFVVYAPTMNLANYLDEGYLFVGDFWLDDLNNGFEELFLTGAFAPFSPPPPPVTPIPEPGTLLLLGGGLIGLGFYARRRKK